MNVWNARTVLAGDHLDIFEDVQTMQSDISLFAADPFVLVVVEHPFSEGGLPQPVAPLRRAGLRPSAGQ